MWVAIDELSNNIKGVQRWPSEKIEMCDLDRSQVIPEGKAFWTRLQRVGFCHVERVGEGIQSEWRQNMHRCQGRNAHELGRASYTLPGFQQPHCPVIEDTYTKGSCIMAIPCLHFCASCEAFQIIKLGNWEQKNPLSAHVYAFWFWKITVDIVNIWRPSLATELLIHPYDRWDSRASER